MTHALDHVLFVVLAVLFPIRAVTIGYRRLDRAEEADVPRVRMWLYRQVLLFQWGFSAVVLAMWLLFQRPWRDLGLVVFATWGLVGVAGGLVFVALLMALQYRGIVGKEEAYERVRRQVRRFARMMPRTPHELRWFAAMSVTAGICEELLYRGYMIWYLRHWLPLGASVAVAAAIFGVGHFYQGPRGMALTAVVGAFMAVVYLVTGSLYASMVIHAAMDLYSGRVTYLAHRGQGAPPAPQPAGAA